MTSAPRSFLDRMALRRNAVERAPSGKLVVADNLAPTVGELASFRDRYLEIQEGLRRAGVEEAKRRMARLFLLFPMPGMGAGMVEEMADAYARALASLPLWAIDRACKKVIDSGATFRPSAPELRKLAAGEVAAFHSEAAALKAIMDAEPYHVNTDNERSRVKAESKALIAELGSTNFVCKKSQVISPPADLASDYAANPIKLSDELVERLRYLAP